MLILTRNVGQEIVIGDDIKIAILGVKGSQVRIGIEAPNNIAVHRKEVWLKIQSEKKEKKSGKDIFSYMGLG